MAIQLHPSKDIVASRSSLMSGKKIALAICGSVAAVRTPDLARELMRNGAEVHAVMTRSAQDLITPEIMEWATGNPVVTALTGKVEHIALGNGAEGSADIVIIAPATANTISKIALGIDDTPVTSLATTAIGAGVPIIVAPAMHATMYCHPAVAENMRKLNEMGIKVVMPDFAEGKAKMAENGLIVDAAVSALSAKDLQGVRALITTGPTRSYMDAIRFLTNSSSGKMGFALAKEAAARGAEVAVVAGPVAVPPISADLINVTTTEEMLSAVLSELGSKPYDLLIMAAAPLDFAFSSKSDGKLSSDTPLTVTLNPLQKISGEARKASSDLFIIGFKAEYGLTADELVSRAQGRLLGSGMDLIVANDLAQEDAGFGADTNEAYVVDREGIVAHIPVSSKREVAKGILDIYEKRRNRNGK